MLDLANTSHFIILLCAEALVLASTISAAVGANRSFGWRVYKQFSAVPLRARRTALAETLRRAASRDLNHPRCCPLALRTTLAVAPQPS
jgi:hypothetical protein